MFLSENLNLIDHFLTYSKSIERSVFFSRYYIFLLSRTVMETIFPERCSGLLWYTINRAVKFKHQLLLLR